MLLSSLFSKLFAGFYKKEQGAYQNALCFFLLVLNLMTLPTRRVLLYPKLGGEKIARYFQKRGKQVQKMTRDGLVEKNLSTGDENRLSQRGQDFELRKHDTPEPMRPAEPTTRRPPSIREQLRNYQQQIHDQSEDTHSPDRFQVAPTGLPMEAARPTARSHEARSHESAAGPPPRRRQATNKTQNATIKPHAAGEYETPPASPKTPYSEEKQRLKHQLTTEESTFTEQSHEQQSQRPGRLKFADETQQASYADKTKRRQQFTPDPANQDSDGFQQKQSRLQFTPDEQPPMADKKIAALQNKAGNVAAKLEKARDKLPTRTRITTQRVYDEATGKGKTKLLLEKEIIPLGMKKRANPVDSGIRDANKIAGRETASEIHQKIAEVEKENVGVEATHKLEQAAEEAYRAGRSLHSAYRFVRERPYRRVAKLEKQAAKANSKLSFQRSIAKKPSMKSKTLARKLQRNKKRLGYAKTARLAAIKTAKAIAGATKAAIIAIKSNPAVIGVIAGILLIVFMLSNMVTSCSNMAISGLGAVLSSSHLAEDADIDNAELIYTEWETDLRLEIENVEINRPGYDEYRYNLDEIGHDPHVLMAYLSARFRDFTFAEVYSELRDLFDEQYQLEYVEEIEVRYRTETRRNPDTGESYQVEVPYNWYILNVNLTSRPLSDVINPRLSDNDRELYDLIMDTGGNRQYSISPFLFDWLPLVTSHYGWRQDPFSDEKEYHTGVDVRVPIGTTIVAGHDGVVSATVYGTTGYGYQVMLNGENGLQTRYAHLNEILVSVRQEVKKGDIIARSGNTGRSTGPHLHFEVLVNGNYLNPLYFAHTTV